MPLRCLWSLIGRLVTTNTTQKECVYSINRINIVQDDDLIYNCVKQFCEYEECIMVKIKKLQCQGAIWIVWRNQRGRQNLPMANTKPLCCGRKHAKNCQRTIKLQRLKSLQRRLERNELSRMYQKAIDTCHTRLRKENERRRNTRKIKQNLVSAPPASISPSEGRQN